jgi:hypothetical protein
MAKFGYGPSNRLRLKVLARDIPRDPAVILTTKGLHDRPQPNGQRVSPWDTEP